ncbi:MAG: SDR family oxidoreductase [Spirochaetales bacterium]|nr:SDR family oxidoreductase [Leptospiraceae bacterium]MCP5482190.1 SDR family oxidoreductase [Spirochaetales bacterium]MCP5484698.1 SDR family oxidoreductase [Spirochaetales bacterium]
MKIRKQKTALVTGGAGFIGSHLCRRLLEREYYVICLDNYFTGRRENVRDLVGNPNFELLRHDVVEPLHIEVDRIYHLACPASPPHYQYNPIKTLKTSIMGTHNMLGLARRIRARIFQASTSEVYGDPEVHPQPESYNGNVSVNGIRSCYDEGKRAAETLCYDYHRIHGVEIRVARIFNTYGPNMDPADGRVVSNFIVQALRGEDLTIYGDGSQTRSFCYVSDLVTGILDLTDLDDFTGPLNIGNDGEFTVRELAELVIRLTGSKSKLVQRPLPEDDPTRRKPDLSLARQKINYRAAVPLEQGLKDTIAYFRDVLLPE